MATIDATFVIIGGGIAGVSCVESLKFLEPDEKVVLISASSLIKKITNIVPIGRMIMKFDVEEQDSTKLASSCTVINDIVTHVDVSKLQVSTKNGTRINYKKLCVCTGAKPRIIYENNPYVIGIRDTESVENFSNKIRNARKIVVVGNGGIATEIIHEVKDVEMVWVIKDKHMSATFFDPGAAEFFKDKLLKEKSKGSDDEAICKRFKYTLTELGTAKQHVGAALGPDWHESFVTKGLATDATKVYVEYECEVCRILNPDELPTKTEEFIDMNWPVYAELTNGKIIGCDFIVSATGVVPNSRINGLEELVRDDINGICVDWKLESSIPDVFAAGDVCTANWDLAKHWFQMRLWTQAHHMGRYAAKSMASTYRHEQFLQDFDFELFTHVTTFFGYKVVLLGLFNGQKLGRDYEIQLRMTRNLEYVKLILQNGRLHGAVLIGNTDLEEMCENLILDQLDLSIYGEDLLNPDIDIEDYFD